MHFASDNGYKILVLVPMLSTLTLDSNKKVTNWMLTKISFEKVKPFHTILEPTISNELMVEKF